MKKIHFVALLSILTMALACRKNKPMPTQDFSAEYNAGGETTVYSATAFAYSTPSPNLNSENLEKHLSGDVVFEVSFTAAPNAINPGLGSVFNNKSCVACHPFDGRAPRPDNINDFSGFFLRASIPGIDTSCCFGGPKPVPGFGTQIQNQAIFGVASEAQYDVQYIETKITYPDGNSAFLRKPIYRLVNSYIPLPSNLLLSPRIGPPVFGLGLLEAIPEEDILALADEHDSNNDGISGKANYVWDEEHQETRLGRFGWKANTPSVMIQSAGAYNGDMGVTSPLFPKETCYGQTNCSPHTNELEVSQEDLDDVVLYLRTLAVPAPRNLENRDVFAGKKLFTDIGCASCHVPKMETGTFPDIPAISNQTIYPYSDMLLHDMGFGLADNRPDFLANGQEWKTRPLWGIGLSQLVNGHTHFLHDGRARNFEEAILWHGGEADPAKNKFVNLTKEERNQVITFLKAL